MVRITHNGAVHDLEVESGFRFHGDGRASIGQDLFASIFRILGSDHGRKSFDLEIPEEGIMKEDCSIIQSGRDPQTVWWTK